MDNTYRFTLDDALKALDFAVAYHLEETKAQRGRTNQGARGLGGVIDEFLIKGLTEIAACKIIGKYNKDIELFPDFNVYTNQEVAKRKDPDVTEIADHKSNSTRKPELHIEIKKVDPKKDNWLIAREDQIKEIFEKKTPGYMVYVSLNFKDEKNKKQQSIAGSVLSEVMNKEIFNLDQFSNISDLEASIDFAYSYAYLKENGMYFPSGLIMPVTSIEPYCVKRGPYKLNGDKSDMFVLINRYNGTEYIQMKPTKKLLNHDTSLFDYWKIKGNFEIHKKVSKGINEEYIYALEESIMENDNIGTFILEKDKTYRFHLLNSLGARDNKQLTKNVSEFAFSTNRLRNLHSDSSNFSIESICKEIAEKI